MREAARCEPGPQGLGSVVPAATGAALVISTPEALKFIRLAQELDCCAHPHGANANVDQNTIHSNFERIAPCFLAPIIARGTL